MFNADTGDQWLPGSAGDFFIYAPDISAKERFQERRGRPFLPSL
jgi:hypothetical protein